MAKMMHKMEILETMREEYGIKFDLYWRLRMSFQ